MKDILNIASLTPINFQSLYLYNMCSFRYPEIVFSSVESHRVYVIWMRPSLSMNLRKWWRSSRITPNVSVMFLHLVLLTTSVRMQGTDLVK